MCIDFPKSYQNAPETTLGVVAFAKEFYKNLAYVSFVDTPDAKNIFEGNYNLDDILLGLSVLTKVQIKPNDTLIILDEIFKNSFRKIS